MPCAFRCAISAWRALERGQQQVEHVVGLLAVRRHDRQAHALPRRPSRRGSRRSAPRCGGASPGSRSRRFELGVQERGQHVRQADSSSRRRPRCTCRPGRGRSGCGWCPSRAGSRRARRSAGSLISSAPPSPQVKFLVSWKLCVGQRAEGAERLALGSVPNRPCALSSTTAMPCAPAMASDRVHLAADAGVVHRRRWPGARRDQRFELRLVEVQRVGADVGEDRARAAQDEGVDRREKVKEGTITSSPGPSRAAAPPSRARGCRRW